MNSKHKIIKAFNPLHPEKLIKLKQEIIKENPDFHEVGYKQHDGTILKRVEEKLIAREFDLTPPNSNIKSIKVRTSYYFTPSEYIIAMYCNNMIINKIHEYQLQNKDLSKDSFLKRQFTISTKEVAKYTRDYGNYSQKEIHSSIYKLFHLIMYVEYYDEAKGKNSTLVSGIANGGDYVFDDDQFTFFPSQLQQLSWRDKYRSPFITLNNDSDTVQYVHTNFDYRGLISTKTTSIQKMTIFYLAKKFEEMHKSLSDKTIKLEFTRDKIEEIKNTNAYQDLDIKLEFNHQKILPKHNNEDDIERIKKDLSREHKKITNQINRDYKKNIVKLCEHDIWGSFFKLSNNKKYVIVNDFTRIDHNPCKVGEDGAIIYF